MSQIAAMLNASLARFDENLKRAEAGDAEAQYSIGNHYLQGSCPTYKDPVQAAAWYRLAASQGHTQAQYQLAELYREGIGVMVDPSEAIRLYRLAAEQGNAQAQNDLATMYLNGIGIHRDIDESVKWYRRAAEQGEPVALYNLANRYRLGEGAPLDAEAAARLLWKSAVQGYGDAQNDLGACYLTGSGVDKDSIIAAAWFLTAAQQTGDKLAMENLAGLKDELTALGHAGSMVARYLVGEMFAEGYGVAPDLALAWAWANWALDGKAPVQVTTANLNRLVGRPGGKRKKINVRPLASQLVQRLRARMRRDEQKIGELVLKGWNNPSTKEGTA